MVISTGPARIEFDRIDFGRVTRLVIFADCGDDERARALGAAGALLAPPGEVAAEDTEAELTGTPVWDARYELAKAAQLRADLDCLMRLSRQPAAGLAAAELASVLHGLGDLAPAAPAEALDIASRQLGDDPLEVQGRAAGTVREIATALSTWAPPEFAPCLRALEQPLELSAGAPPPPAAEQIHAGRKHDWLDLEAGLIEWTGATGAFSLGLRQGTGTIHRDDTGLMRVEAPTPHEDEDEDADEPQWVSVWDDDTLVAGGPLVRSGSTGTAWFGPLDSVPTSAAVTAHLYRDAGRGPVAQLTDALHRARLALTLEPESALEAARCWWDSAEDWLGVNELGRAAIAYDRSARGYARAGHGSSAARARERARAYAPLWALPSLDGRSGDPYRPAWQIADPDAAIACAKFPLAVNSNEETP